MSILINMEMPTSCLSCPLQGGTADCRLTQKTYNWGLTERPSDCPLIEVPEWIPVEEKVPEEKGNYLVVQDCWNGAEVHEAFFFRRDNDYGWFDPVEEYEKYNPTHWMPLPEPPEVKS